MEVGQRIKFLEDLSGLDKKQVANYTSALIFRRNLLMLEIKKIRKELKRVKKNATTDRLRKKLRRE